MYERYSGLQLEQLQEQEYIETQAQRVVVYAPGRNARLTASLCRQLHQNHRLVVFPEELRSVSGEVYVIAADDCELMSTALMQFANAIADGNDLCYCDAVFGPEGNTLRLASENFDRRYGNIVAISASLFAQLAEECGGIPDCLALIDRAGALSAHTKHIPLALVCCRRELSAPDVFLPGKRRALLITHEYSMTGAPLVLANAIPVLKNMGFDVAVLGPQMDGAVHVFQAAGIPVLANPAKLGNSALYGLALSSDLVLANTIVELDTVLKLENSAVPVIWWLHEPPSYIHSQSPRMPAGNVSVCAVGQFAANAMLSLRPNYIIDQLLYGLPDYAKGNYPPCDFVNTEGKLLFVNIGTIEERKGQDILVEAIRQLPEHDLRRALFLFVGKAANDRIMASILDILRQYPKNICYIPLLSRTEIMSLMDYCQCIICSSRSDPMPTFVTEGAIFGKPVILSEHTGTASLVTQGENAFVYHNDDPGELSKSISYVINHPDCLEAMRPHCRSLYEDNFSIEVFSKKLTELVTEALKKPAVL